MTRRRKKKLVLPTTFTPPPSFLLTKIYDRRIENRFVQTASINLSLKFLVRISFEKTKSFLRVLLSP